MLSVRADGAVHGMAFRSGGAWALGKGRGNAGSGTNGPLRSSKARPHEFTPPPGNACSNDVHGGMWPPQQAAPRPTPRRQARPRRLLQTILDQTLVANVALGGCRQPVHGEGTEAGGLA